MKRIYADSHPPLLNPRDIDFLLTNGSTWEHCVTGRVTASTR